MIVLHYTGMRTVAEALERLCTPGTEVSAHYVIFEDGRIIQSVPEARRAWHAGASSWGGVTDINSRSIGIEIANPGHDHGYIDFPTAQIEAVIALCRDITHRLKIAPQRVLGHSDIAPQRKQDPGERFSWETLYANGIGHWTAPVRLATSGRTLRPGDIDSEVSELQRKLSAYGYAAPLHGIYDTHTEACVRAFQRHFRRGLIDGLADASTRLTLGALLRSTG